MTARSTVEKTKDRFAVTNWWGGVSGVVDCVLMHGFSEVSAEVAWSPKDNDRVHPWPDQRLHYCPFLLSDVCICDFQRQGSRFAAKVTLTTPWRHP